VKTTNSAIIAFFAMLGEAALAWNGKPTGVLNND
jgi:hypothetical protein